MTMNSPQVRAALVEALRLDLVGPDNDHLFARELLPESPTRWYLTGFLVPRGAPEEQRIDPQADDQIDAGDDIEADDGAPPDRAAAGKSYLPSSLGLSVLVAPGVERLEAHVVWGDYEFEGAAERAELEEETAESNESAESPEGDGKPPKPLRGYRRLPREETISLRLPAADAKPWRRTSPPAAG